MAITQSTILPLIYGEFRISYHSFDEGTCVSISYGDLNQEEPIIRIHSSCLFGESFHALDCDCADQLSSTLQLIKENRSGVVVYQNAEGRGIGLENKIKALELQRTLGIDTVEAFRRLGFKPDLRNYTVELAALADLAINTRIQVASQNPHKIQALQDAGYSIVKNIQPRVHITKYNIPELIAKRDLLGYSIAFDETVRVTRSLS